MYTLLLVHLVVVFSGTFLYKIYKNINFKNEIVAESMEKSFSYTYMYVHVTAMRHVHCQKDDLGQVICHWSVL